MNLKNKKAVALIISYLSITVLTILGAAFVIRSTQESRAALTYAKSLKAFWLAEAGLQRALWELNVNNLAGTTVCETNKCISDTIPSSGDYDVVINLTARTIIASGSFPSRSATNKKTRTIFANLNSSGSVFTHAIFSKGAIQLSNSARVDSYNSTTDLNATVNLGNGAVGTNASGSDAVTIDAVILSNTSKIYGNVSTGPNGEIALYNSAQVIVEGTTYSRATESLLNSISNHSNNRELPSVVIPESLSGLTTASAINLWGTPPNTGSTHTLTSGNYKIPSITLSNSSKLTISGDVTLYVTGNAYASNSSSIEITSGSSLTLYIDGILGVSNTAKVNNVTKIPSKFLVYSRYGSPNGIQMSNNLDLYGAVYAPDTEVVLSNSVEFFGAFVTKTMNLSNSTKVHYDEALQNLGGGSSGNYSVTTWQEI